MKNEKLDQMVHEEMYLCFGKTEQLLRQSCPPQPQHG